MGNTLNYKATMDEQNFLVIKKFLNKRRNTKNITISRQMAYTSIMYIITYSK